MKYSKPGQVGGKLIREVVASIREFSGLTLPLDSHILIAVSGGCDSMALAKLLVRYGRRVVGAQRIRLVHINHGWRGEESIADEAFVRAAAKRWKVPISVFRLDPVSLAERPGSPEEVARSERKRIFETLSKRYGTRGQPAWIFTAHHADDLAETLVWRFCTGTLGTHGGGIHFKEGRELRPFLRVRKRQLAAFLKEEGETWREDRTNFEGRLLRSRMRLELMPILEQFFPKVVENLVRSGLEVQKERLLRGAESTATVGVDPGVLFSAAGIRARRAHWEWVDQKLLRKRQAKMDLPGGWVLRHELDRWILERKSE